MDGQNLVQQVTYTNGQTITPTADMTLYAVWGEGCNHEATTKAYETLLDDGFWYETHEVIETCNACNKIVSREEEDCNTEYSYWYESYDLCSYDYWCTECGSSYGGSMDHDWGWSYTAVYATCLSDGEEVYECSNCHNTYTEYVATGCVPDGGTVITEPTCGSAGEMSYSCLWCGRDMGTGPIPATEDHSIDATSKAATCTEDGYFVDYCTVCYETLSYEEIEATGHDYSNYVGAGNFECVNCGEPK